MCWASSQRAGSTAGSGDGRALGEASGLRVAEYMRDNHTVSHRGHGGIDKMNSSGHRNIPLDSKVHPGFAISPNGIWLTQLFVDRR